MGAPGHARNVAPRRRDDGKAALRAASAAAILRDHAHCIERARRLLLDSREHAGGIAVELAAVRRRLADSRAVLERSARASAAVYALQHPPQLVLAEPDAPAEAGAEPACSFAAITELVAEIEQTARRAREPIDDLISQIKRVLASDPDASILIGVLVEGVAQAVRQLVPEVEQLDMLVAAMAMLRDRTLLPEKPGG